MNREVLLISLFSDHRCHQHLLCLEHPYLHPRQDCLFSRKCSQVYRTRPLQYPLSLEHLFIKLLCYLPQPGQHVFVLHYWLLLSCPGVSRGHSASTAVTWAIMTLSCSTFPIIAHTYHRFSFSSPLWSTPNSCVLTPHSWRLSVQASTVFLKWYQAVRQSSPRWELVPHQSL